MSLHLALYDERSGELLASAPLKLIGPKDEVTIRLETSDGQPFGYTAPESCVVISMIVHEDELLSGYRPSAAGDGDVTLL